MAEIDLMSVRHKSTERDYLARVKNHGFSKAKAAELCNLFDYNYLKVNCSMMQSPRRVMAPPPKG